MSDLISRQAAIDAVNAYLGLSQVSRTIQDMTSIQEILKDLPSAQPELGRWIDTLTDHYKCSCCGVRASYWFNEENSCGWDEDMSEWLSDYCPNCGARMDGEYE